MLSCYCSGKKRERRLKQTAVDDTEEEDDDDDDDDGPQVDASDPMMGFTFNECNLICISENFFESIFR